MTLRACYQHFLTAVKLHYSAGEAEAITRMIWEDLAGIDRAVLLRAGDTPVSPELRNRMEAVLSRVEKLEPVQYITGWTEFAGLKIQVNLNVLIPRPETEELVHWIMADLADQHSSCRILDVGTGSGCIALALKKKYPHAAVTAVDASSGALKVAESNARQHGLTVDFRLLNFLDPAERDRLPKVHVIVSNPPYIPASDAAEMEDNVRLYEPSAALFVPDEDPLIFYRALAECSSTHLLPQGALYVETSSRFGSATAALLRETFSSVEIKTDLSGHERMIKAFNS